MIALTRRGFLIGAGAVAAAAAMPAKAVPAGWVAINPAAQAYWMGRDGLYVLKSPGRVWRLFNYDSALDFWSERYFTDGQYIGDIPVIDCEEPCSLPPWRLRTSARSATTPPRNTSRFNSKTARRIATRTFRPRSMRA